MNNKIYYVYKIYNTVLDKYYIGSRTISKYVDILNGYNTSSKTVHNLIDEYGIESFVIKSIQIFDTVEKALEEENKQLKSIKDEDRNKYLNINFSAGGAVIIAQTHNRIYNTKTKKYSYYPKNLPLPENCIFKTRSIPPSRKGYKKYINLKTNETFMSKDIISDNDVKLYKDYINEIKKNEPTKTIWITNGTINTKVAKHEDIPDGWRLGKTVKWTKVIITNGKEDKYIGKNESLPDGWRYGTCRDNSHTKGMIRITNGIETTTISKEDKIPDGWYRGTLSSGNKKYYIDGNIFNRKKDILEYLNVTAAKFDVDYKKGVYKNLIVKEKQK